MLNLEKLAYELLTRQFPELTVLPELDVDSLELDSLPVLTFIVTSGDAVAAGTGRPTAWNVTLSLNLFDDDLDDAIAHCGTVYDGVWDWDDPFNPAGIVDELGHAAEIDDQSLFTRVSSADVGDRTLTHMAGAFTMQMHQA